MRSKSSFGIPNIIMQYAFNDIVDKLNKVSTTRIGNTTSCEVFTRRKVEMSDLQFSFGDIVMVTEPNGTERYLDFQRW